MRVSLFADLADPKWLSLSMERYAFELKKGLEKLNLSDLEVVSFQPEIPGPFTYLPTYWRYYLSRYYYYPFFAQRHEGQINHILDHSFAQIAQFVDKEKTIVTCHDLIPLKLLPDGTTVEKDLKAKDLFRKSVNYLKEVRFVLADSKATKKDLETILGIEGKKIKVIYLGKNDGPRSEFNGAEFRNKHKIPSDKPIILHVGHNLTYKNIDGILKALTIVKEKKPFTFVKVGPEFTDQQKELVDRFNLKDMLIETGFLSEKELNGLYSISQVLVYPSLFEGFGLPVLEAMNSGLIPVISQGTSLEEITGSDGILVDPHSEESIAGGIIKVLEMKTEESVLLKEKLRIQASLFSWEKTAAETYQVYKEIYE